MEFHSRRARDLPVDALVTYMMASGLFMAVFTGEVLRLLEEGLDWVVEALREGGCSGGPTASTLSSRSGRRRFAQKPHYCGARRTNADLRVEEVLPDSSELSRVYPAERDKRKKCNGLILRGIEYPLEGVADSKLLCRFISNLVDCEKYPAQEPAAL